MTALYSEMDPFAAAWLRELVKAGAIAPGDVDERDIRDLEPDYVGRYTQFHAYAGIGVWSYALRQAGWPDDKPVWTFSEPCQPFSAAGKRGGTADERYLRPFTHHLVSVCRPPVCFGEQVASKDGLGWLDTLQADLEGEGYAVGAADTCSAGHGVAWDESQAGEWLQRAIHDCDDPWSAAQLRDFADWAPGNLAEGGNHIRQRLRFGAVRLDDDDDARLEGQRSGHRAALGHGQGTVRPASEAGEPGGLADAHGRDACAERQQCGGERRQQPEDGGIGGVADLPASGRREERADAGGLDARDRAERQPAGLGASGGDSRADPHNFDGRSADWLFCRDAGWRAVRSGSFPLASKAPARVGRLRGYGNAVDAEATIQFIEAFIEAYQDVERLRLTSVSLPSPIQPDDGVFG